jgi:hypothetical protein
MKKQLVYLLFATALFTGFAACKKCKECESTITTTKKEAGVPDSTGTITKNEGQLCEGELNSVDGKTITTNSSNGKSNYTTVKKTTCN